MPGVEQRQARGKPALGCCYVPMQSLRALSPAPFSGLAAELEHALPERPATWLPSLFWLCIAAGERAVWRHGGAGAQRAHLAPGRALLLAAEGRAAEGLLLPGPLLAPRRRASSALPARCRPPFQTYTATGSSTVLEPCISHASCSRNESSSHATFHMTLHCTPPFVAHAHSRQCTELAVIRVSNHADAILSACIPRAQRSAAARGWMRWSARRGCWRRRGRTCACQWPTWCMPFLSLRYLALPRLPPRRAGHARMHAVACQPRSRAACDRGGCWCCCCRCATRRRRSATSPRS